MNTDNNKAIGGFIELELPLSIKNDLPTMFSCGRHGLLWLLKCTQCKKIHLPAYICPVVYELINNAGIDINFYHIDDQLTPEQYPNIQNDEYFIYVNYFGTKDDVCRSLISQFGSKLILDLTQAFFFDVPTEIKSFSSARKFFGVPDGSIVTGINTIKAATLPRYNGAENADHLLLRCDGKLQQGYSKFVKHGSSFNQMMQISELSQKILQRIDMKDIANKRFKNFSFLHKFLGSTNLLKNLAQCSALCYPYLVDNGWMIKKKLCENKIFVPTYWPQLNTDGNLSDFEKNLVNNLICLPIDQRYDQNDMRYVLKKIKDLS